MRVPLILLTGLLISQLFSLGTPLSAQEEKQLQIPGATLLMGWPLFQLEITSENKTVKIQSDEGEWLITPSISADGLIVAAARLQEGQFAAPRARSTLVISTYSITKREWKEYKEVTTFGGPVAIAPDGTRLACFTWGTGKSIWSLRVVDVKNESTTTFREFPQRVSGMPQITWSPDSKHIAIDDAPEPYAANSSDMSNPARLSQIYVMDLYTGVVHKIANGWLPSWSPSGEWVAYFDYPALKHDRWPMNLVVPERINPS